MADAGHRGDRRLAVVPVVAVTAGLALGAYLADRRGRDAPPVVPLAPASTDAAFVDPQRGPVTVSPDREPTADLGPLGVLDSSAEVRAAVRAALTRGPLPGRSPTPCRALEPAVAGLVVIGSYGSGTRGSQPVTVLTGTAADGVAVAVVLRSGDCQLLERVELGPL